MEKKNTRFKFINLTTSSAPAETHAGTTNIHFRFVIYSPDAAATPAGSERYFLTLYGINMMFTKI